MDSASHYPATEVHDELADWDFIEDDAQGDWLSARNRGDNTNTESWAYNHLFDLDLSEMGEWSDGIPVADSHMARCVEY